jgi:death-on-curing protein
MQIAEHGGALGIRDRGLLESEFGGADDDVPLLAAMHAIAIVHNHPFIDGNKRVAFVALETFLNVNGFRLSAGDASCVLQTVGLAAGESSDEAFISWVRKNARPASQNPEDASEA